MMLMVKARHSQHIVFYKNLFYCPIEGPQGAKSLQWYIIMRCRKGIFELENIVNMATLPLLIQFWGIKIQLMNM